MTSLASCHVDHRLRQMDTATLMLTEIPWSVPAMREPAAGGHAKFMFSFPSTATTVVPLMLAKSSV